MNDFEYDCLQKKRLARQAKYRKCGSKSKKCPLSTDHMTQKEWKERCGVILSINLNRPVAWDVFKQLGKSTQEQYVRHLMDVFGANATSLAAMFDVQPLTVRRYITAKGLDVSFPVGKSMNVQQKEDWGKFLNGEWTAPESVSAQAEEKATSEDLNMAPASEDKVTQVSYAKTSEPMEMSMKKVCLSFSGKIDIAAISNSLLHVLGRESAGEVEITCILA